MREQWTRSACEAETTEQTEHKDNADKVKKVDNLRARKQKGGEVSLAALPSYRDCR
ncbi:MAG: hypothetical protein ACREMY_21920 [bacterium]